MSVFVECKSRNTARKRWPGAARIVKVTGGFIVFLTMDAYHTWCNQK